VIVLCPMMSNKLVAAIEPLLAVPVAAWMEASKGVGNREVLPEVAPQIAVAFEGLSAGFISAGKSELRFVIVYGLTAIVNVSKKKKTHPAPVPGISDITSA
jgi:hypothetical protein